MQYFQAIFFCIPLVYYLEVFSCNESWLAVIWFHDMKSRYQDVSGLLSVIGDGNDLVAVICEVYT